MSSGRRIQVGTFLVITLLSISMAQAEPGRTALGVLTRSFDARTAGLSEAGVADSGEISVLSLNPAGMANLPKSSLSLTYQRGLAEDSFGYIAYGQKMKGGSLFASVGYLDAGKINLNLSDGTRGERNAQQDWVGSAGFSFGRTGPIFLGVAGKFFRSELAETASATGVAADAGLLWHPWKPFGLGVAVQNMGSDIKYEESNDSLPTLTRFGASYVFDARGKWRYPDILRCRYLLVFDGVKERYESLNYVAGLEIRHNFDFEGPDNWATLRAGYKEATKAPSLGIGFQFANFSMDYSIDFVEKLDRAHRFSLGLEF